MDMSPLLAKMPLAFGASSENRANSIQASNVATPFSADSYSLSSSSPRFGNTESAEEPPKAEINEDKTPKEGVFKKAFVKTKAFFTIEDFTFKASAKGAGQGLLSYFTKTNGLLRDVLINLGIGAVLGTAALVSGLGVIALPGLLPVLGVTMATFSTVQLTFRMVKGFFRPNAYQTPEADSSEKSSEKNVDKNNVDETK